MSKTITFRAPDDLVDALGSLARASGVTRTKLIVSIVSAKLDEVEALLAEEETNPNVVSPPAVLGTSVILPACSHTYVQGFRCLACGKAA